MNSLEDMEHELMFHHFSGKIRGIIPYQPQFTKYDVDLVANGDGEDGSQPCPQCDDNQVFDFCLLNLGQSVASFTL